MISGCGRFGSDEARICAVFAPEKAIAHNRSPIDISRMPPAINKDTAVEWPAGGGDDDAVVFVRGAGLRFTPMQFEAPEFQCIKPDKQVLRPLETEAALFDSAVNKDVVEKRWPHYLVVTPELARRVVNAFCQPCRFFRADLWGKCGDLVHQALRCRKIASCRLQPDLALWFVGGDEGVPSRENANGNGR